MKIRSYYYRVGDLKFISHLNTVDLLQRAVLSTGYGIEFSQGFNPHPKMSFSNPLPLGASSKFEVFDVELKNKTDIKKFVKEVNEYLPNEVQIFEAFNAEKLESISKSFNFARYKFTFDSHKKLDDIKFSENEQIIITKYKKDKTSKEKIEISEDISSYIRDISGFNEVFEGTYELYATLENSIDKIISPINFIEAVFEKYDINIEIYDVFIEKEEMF